MTRHVRPLPQPQKVSDPAQLRFRFETFSAIHRELLPLFKRHWQEIAIDHEHVPLDPDWDCYFALEAQGKLLFLTARSGRELVGYVSNIVDRHLHYAGTRFAHTEMFWLDPAFRKGWQPVKMLLTNIKGLEDRGVEIGTINFKLHFKNARVGKVLARLGYVPTDIVMRRVF